jgi:NADP-dependent 3-hydroxy acid dehydrogenase YdfG
MTALAGQVAVVTGASSGIGRAIVLDLAARGASVCLIGRRLATLSTVADDAARSGARAVCYPADLTVENAIDELAGRLRSDFGRVDILVHSAGVISWGHLATADMADLDRQYATNVRAPYLLTRAVLPMLRHGSGQVVFVNSSLGLSARQNVGQYAATKHALRAIADSLREEVNAEGIRVLSVFLGRTASPMQAAVHAMEGREYQPERLVQPENVAAVVLNALCLPLTAEVTDISIRPMLKPQ